MKLLIDKRSARQAVFITSTTEYGPTRRYYEIPVRGEVTLRGDESPNGSAPCGALLRLDGNLALEQIAGRVVDARLGQDEARPGFTLDEGRLGQKRLKITISRVIAGPHKLTLGQALRQAYDAALKRRRRE